jgi:hypothetical protein
MMTIVGHNELRHKGKRLTNYTPDFGLMNDPASREFEMNIPSFI